MNAKIIAPIAIVLVIIVGVLAWMSMKPKNDVASATPTPVTSSTPSAAVATATITYANSGFTPATTTVKSGETITFVNNSSSTIQVDSDPHPAHTDNTELNVGSIPAGGKATITVSKTGTFGIHNHLDPSMTAKITVQ